MTITLTIPGEPVTTKAAQVNLLPRKGTHFPAGVTMQTIRSMIVPIPYIPANVRQYQNLVKRCAEDAGRGRMLTGATGIQLDAIFARPKSYPKTKSRPHIVKPDPDNIANKTIDAIRKILIADDAQVNTLCVTKRYHPNPDGASRIDMQLWPTTADPPTYQELVMALQYCVNRYADLQDRPFIAGMLQRLDSTETP